MGVRKTIKKIKDAFIPKDKPTPISGGNSYETAIALEVQKQLDLQTLSENSSSYSMDRFTELLKKYADEYINEKNINPYFLLHYQANYFCGTCKFETTDMFLKRLVLLVIRGAFLLGCAGILKRENELCPYFLTDLKYGVNGKLLSCKAVELELMISAMNKNQGEVNNINFLTLNKNECENLAVFQWGVMGFSAWMTIWPFVQFQHSLLKMIIIQSFVYNKKFIYNSKNMNVVDSEMRLFFDPTNPFIVNVSMNQDIPNRISTEDMGKGFEKEGLLEYYNQTINAYYHILGRRVNTDIKKERNVSNEVEASQENYDVVQSDWLNFFEIFISELQRISGIDIRIVKETEKENDNDSATNNPDQDNQPTT